MKKINIIYWVSTVIFAGFMGASGIPDIMKVPSAVQIVNTHLGYPAYFIVFVGIAKVLGAIAILIPGFPRIKEWAYAGLVFDLVAATYSAAAVGDPISQWGFMAVFFLVAAVSYIYYHKKLNGTHE
ncbi:MAG TPA: DoxX family protein [Bacteroidia bacterium]|jgi:uncharacterized membrane protein YphA (DoxX/SURF4 family)|nr:DoxX family protein [Bacteroidia bacterium]